MIKAIKHVQLHKALFIPGYGDLNQRTLNHQFFPGIKMKMHPMGVSVELSKGSKTLYCIIPAVMIEVIVFELLVKEESDAKKASR